jgi:trk system potassium uptake protein TrkH
MIFSLSMGLPLAVSLWTGDGGVACDTRCRHGQARWRRAPGSGGACAVFRQELQPRHGVMLVSLVWLLLPLFAALPLMLAGHHMGGRCRSRMPTSRPCRA